MLEVVFSDSACGSLKAAQHFGEGKYNGGCIGIILGKDEVPSSNLGSSSKIPLESFDSGGISLVFLTF